MYELYINGRFHNKYEFLLSVYAEYRRQLSLGVEILSAKVYKNGKFDHTIV